MKKVLIIDRCNMCCYFDNNWGERCIHPKITKFDPDSKDCIPKYFEEPYGLNLIKIPDWCPLETIK
jgi:hypothetical protein